MPLAADPDSASVDTLTCGVCQKDFALADIVKFIQHKVLTCNKENHPCKSKGASAAANESDGESNNNSADADKPALENGEKGKGARKRKMVEGASSSSSDKENSAGSGGSKKKQKRGVQPLPPVTEMAAAAAATTSFDDLPDELLLKIFKMAALEVL